MDQTIYLAAVLGFYRETVTVATHGNNGILEIGAHGTVQKSGHGRMDFVIHSVNTAADLL